MCLNWSSQIDESHKMHLITQLPKRLQLDAVWWYYTQSASNYMTAEDIAVGFSVVDTQGASSHMSAGYIAAGFSVAATTCQHQRTNMMSIMP